MHDTPALIVDPAAIRAWLAQPSDTYPDTSRADNLGIDDELTGPGMGDFLDTVDDVLAAQPHGLHRRADIDRVELWLIPDGEVLGQGALITVDLANGVRLASMHQDIRDFATGDQHGIPAVLTALTHVTNQVALLLDTYHTATVPTPRPRSGGTAVADREAGPAGAHPDRNTAGATPAMAGRVTVAELIERLRVFPPQLQVWVADPGSVEGYAPLDGTVHPGSDPAPPATDPAAFVVLGAAR